VDMSTLFCVMLSWAVRRFEMAQFFELTQILDS
jgi:hypothetical protein